MAKPRQSYIEVDDPLVRQQYGSDAYGVVGQIAEMQANIARRLADDRRLLVSTEPAAERLVRSVSRIAGYGSLLAGYCLLTMAILRLT